MPGEAIPARGTALRSLSSLRFGLFTVLSATPVVLTYSVQVLVHSLN
jgi:hypothetical protein